MLIINSDVNYLLAESHQPVNINVVSKLRDIKVFLKTQQYIFQTNYKKNKRTQTKHKNNPFNKSINYCSISYSSYPRIYGKSALASMVCSLSCKSWVTVFSKIFLTFFSIACVICFLNRFKYPI